jgi:TetR/AcrR family transcriptional regulator, mexJK operon transcriptional repressor
VAVRETTSKRSPRLGSGNGIRAAAAKLFLEKGYAATSMDDVAAAARISKQTIYTHFHSKENLFAELVLGNAERAEEFAASIVASFRAESDLETGLRNVARTYLRFVIRPEVVQLRRLVIGEAVRFPELARRYYEGVPERVYVAFAALLKELRDEKRLAVADPDLAAHEFAWLVLGWPLDRAMFYGTGSGLRGLDLDRIADEAVRIFLAAYPANVSAAAVSSSH